MRRTEPQMLRGLRLDEVELLDTPRCGVCCHLIGLHAEDDETGADYCAVCLAKGEYCWLREFGPPRDPRFTRAPRYSLSWASVGA